MGNRSLPMTLSPWKQFIWPLWWQSFKTQTLPLRTVNARKKRYIQFRRTWLPQSTMWSILLSTYKGHMFKDRELSQLRRRRVLLRWWTSLSTKRYAGFCWEERDEERKTYSSGVSQGTSRMWAWDRDLSWVRVGHLTNWAPQVRLEVFTLYSNTHMHYHPYSIITIMRLVLRHDL